MKISTTVQAPESARTLEPGSAKFSCGEDAKVQAPIVVRATTVVLAGDGRLYSPCPDGNHFQDHREIREGALLNVASGSPDPEIRWRAAQALARIGRGIGAVLKTPTVRPVCSAEVQIFGSIYEPLRWQPGELFMLVRDRDPRVRRQAAFGIGYALSRPGLDPNVAAAARKELEACILIETTQPGGSPDVAGLLTEAIGVARYGAVQDRAAAAAYLVERSRRPAPLEVLGAAKGLEALIRQSSGWEVPEPVKVRLRELVASGQASVLAMSALQAARDSDLATLQRASGSTDFQVRRLVAMGLNLDDPAHARIAEGLSHDMDFKVRYEYLGSLARQIQRTRQCAPLAAYLDDLEPTVVLHALDLLSARCTDLDDIVDKVAGEAKRIGKTETHEHWQVPSRALTALARLRPDAAKPLMEAAVKHPVWQVRAAAAPVLVSLERFEDVVQLAHDPRPNVQTAALEALTRAKRGEAIDAAIDVLNKGIDFQVMRAAANAITTVPDARRNDAVDALLSGMSRLTLLEEDPSRDPRVAILAALGRVMPAQRKDDLLPYLRDLDDDVIAAAAKAYQNIAGVAPPRQARLRRYLYQPSEQALSNLPGVAVIEFEEGTIEIRLLKEEAPVTIARFAALVKAGYYNGLTFHRIVPNFVVQGGSPGASEYVGTSRYMRDEVGPAYHLRGAVGISTRGHDTGDAQIFIDLVDLPRLDRDYTVFGYVTVSPRTGDGMAIVDRLLEGALIKSIYFK